MRTQPASTRGAREAAGQRSAGLVRSGSRTPRRRGPRRAGRRPRAGRGASGGGVGRGRGRRRVRVAAGGVRGRTRRAGGSPPGLVERRVRRRAGGRRTGRTPRRSPVPPRCRRRRSGRTRAAPGGRSGVARAQDQATVTDAAAGHQGEQGQGGRRAGSGVSGGEELGRRAVEGHARQVAAQVQEERAAPPSSRACRTGPSSRPRRPSGGPGPRPIAESPARGRVPGRCGPRRPRSTPWRPAGSTHQASRSSGGAGRVRGGPSRSPGCTAAGSPCPPRPRRPSRRRSWTSGWAPRARRRASTRPGLPLAELGDRAAGARVLHARARPAATTVRSARAAISASWVARTTVMPCERAAVVRVRSTWARSARCSGRRRLVGEQHRRARGPGRGRWQTRWRSAWSSCVRAFAGAVADVEALQPLQGGGLGARGGWCRAASAAGRRSPRR